MIPGVFFVLIAVALPVLYGLAAFVTDCRDDRDCRETIGDWRTRISRQPEDVKLDKSTSELRSNARSAVIKIANAKSDNLGDKVESLIHSAEITVKNATSQWWDDYWSFMFGLMKRWRLTGLTLPAVALAIDYLHYQYFNFSVLPYYSGSLVTEIILHLSISVAVALVSVVGSVGVLLIIRILEVLRIITIIIGFLIKFSGACVRITLFAFRYAAIALSFACCRWTPLGRLALFLVRKIPTVHAVRSVVRGAREALSSFFASVLHPFAPADSAAPLSGINVIVKIGAVASFVVVLAYIMAFEAQYRAYAACDVGDRVVVRPELESIDDPMSIGSKGEYVFLVSSGLCESTAATESGSAEGESSTNGNTNAENRCKSRRDCLRKLRWSQPINYVRERLKGRGGYRTPVVVVPLSHVYCLYAGSGEDNDRCRPVASSVRVVVVDDDEKWLREEIARRISCEEAHLSMSEPLVFQPHQGTIANDEQGAARTWAENAVAELRTQEIENGRIYLFGFASADGEASNNERLSRSRIAAVGAYVDEALDGDDAWNGRRPTVERRALGEMHWTNGVAASRSVRIVACATPAGSDSAADGETPGSGAGTGA